MILDPSHVLLVVRQPPGDLGAFGTFVPSKIDRLGSSNPKHLGKTKLCSVENLCCGKCGYML